MVLIITVILIVGAGLLSVWIKKEKEVAIAAASLVDPLKQSNKNVLPAEKAELIKYGKELIAHTSKYFGPTGSIAIKANTLNCQSCHLEAGTKKWGNNYLAVFATYPRFRERSGTIETIQKRVSDCFERSLNGPPPDSLSKEMRAIISYIE